MIHTNQTTIIDTDTRTQDRDAYWNRTVTDSSEAYAQCTGELRVRLLPGGPQQERNEAVHAQYQHHRVRSRRDSEGVTLRSGEHRVECCRIGIRDARDGEVDSILDRVAYGGAENGGVEFVAKPDHDVDLQNLMVPKSATATSPTDTSDHRHQKSPSGETHYRSTHHCHTANKGLRTLIELSEGAVSKAGAYPMSASGKRLLSSGSSSRTRHSCTSKRLRSGYRRER